MSVSTELRLVGDRAQFLVQTDEPDYRRALADLAFEEQDDGFVRSFPGGGTRACTRATSASS